MSEETIPVDKIPQFQWEHFIEDLELKSPLLLRVAQSHVLTIDTSIFQRLWKSQCSSTSTQAAKSGNVWDGISCLPIDVCMSL